MRINIISNLANGKGLERDVRILHALLAGWGHDVTGCQFDRPPATGPADLNLFVETVAPTFFDLAPRQYLVPNPEWWLDRYHKHIGRFDRVLCKTEDALRLFSPLTPHAVFAGFMSEDHYRDAPRSPVFLHNAGQSIVKGTQAVLDAWRTYAIPHALVVLGSIHLSGEVAPNVRIVRRLGDDDFVTVQNGCRFHLCPSEYEGWGHSLHEGMGVGALVVTTDTPPMNGFGCARTVPAVSYGTQRLATTAKVSADGIRDAVEWCVALGEAEANRISARAREAFLRDREEFPRRLRKLLTD